MYSGSEAIKDFKVWTKQLLWDLQNGLQTGCLCMLYLFQRLQCQCFYSADAYQCKRPISVGDPCIALCKGFQKACEMLQAEIRKTFWVTSSKACFDPCNKHMLLQVRWIKLQKTEQRDQNTLWAILYWCLFSITLFQSMQVYSQRPLELAKEYRLLWIQVCTWKWGTYASGSVVSPFNFFKIQDVLWLSDMNILKQF